MFIPLKNISIYPSSNVILASCKYHFIRVHENLVQHPTNNKSIII